MYKSERGMTLIEVMVIIAIIGILAAIVIPIFNEMHKRSLDPSYGKVVEQDGIDAVEAVGYFDARVTQTWTRSEVKQLGCRSADNAGFTVRAKNNQEKELPFLVCCNMMNNEKYCTPTLRHPRPQRVPADETQASP